MCACVWGRGGTRLKLLATSLKTKKFSVGRLDLCNMTYLEGTTRQVRLVRVNQILLL